MIPRACTAGAALAVAALAAGCGSSSPAPDAKLLNSPQAHVSRQLRAQEKAIHLQVTAALHHPDHQRYGKVAGYLPKSHIPVNRIVTATPAHPALAIEGNAVRLVLAAGRALATAVGPDIPERQQGSFHNQTDASFVFTFAKVSGTLKLDPHMFSILTENGQVLHPRITTMNGGPLPAVLRAGTTVTLTLRATLTIGSGTLRYTPAGGHYLAAWDFDAETD